jgi:hypothetical protein
VVCEPIQGHQRRGPHDVKQRLRIEVVPAPTPDAQRELDACLDVLAEALADRLIDQARAAIAQELGVDEARIDREAGREAHGAREALGFAGFGEAS